MRLLTSLATIVLIMAFVGVVWRSRRRRRASVGPGAAGAFYALLDADRRAAVQIVVEERAAYRDPEDAEGDLPELARPRVKR